MRVGEPNSDPAFRSESTKRSFEKSVFQIRNLHMSQIKSNGRFAGRKGRGRSVGAAVKGRKTFCLCKRLLQPAPN